VLSGRIQSTLQLLGIATQPLNLPIKLRNSELKPASAR
jgi:hypothetical protein